MITAKEKTCSIRLAVNVVQRLRDLALLNGRTISGQAGIILREFISRVDAGIVGVDGSALHSTAGKQKRKRKEAVRQ